jgi:hypothetical protein
MSADVIAQHDHVMGRQPVHSVLTGADAVGKLLPALVHQQGGAHDARKADHIVMNGHAEVDEFSSHECFFIGLP